MSLTIYESIDIIERIDQLPGPNTLMDFDDEQREKYERLKELH